MSVSSLKFSGKMMFRHFRRTHRMTQRQLGLALGCTTRHVKYIEAGTKFPSSELMRRFKDLVSLHEQEARRPMGVREIDPSISAQDKSFAR